MTHRIITAVVVALTLGASAAYAATQLASSEGTEVCVNQTNGLIRASSTCREGEDPMTIGGGGDVQVTQGGTFTVAAGATSTPTPLPLTGVTIAGMCELGTPPAPTPEFVLARIVLSTTGGTMDAFTSVGSGPTGSGATLGGTSLTTAPVAAAGFAPVSNGLGSAIVMASGATATITFGARADATARNCTYLWQATVAPN